MKQFGFYSVFTMFIYQLNCVLKLKILLSLSLFMLTLCSYPNLLLFSLTFVNFSNNFNILYFLSFFWTSASTFSSFFLVLLGFHLTYYLGYKFVPKIVIMLVLYVSFSFIYSNSLYIYKDFRLDQSFMNNLLLNQLNHIHPFILYLSFTFILINYLKMWCNEGNYFYYSYLSNLVAMLAVSTTSVFLGSWWALQEGDWGGWWAWDPSEVLSLWLFFYLFYVIHFTNKCLVNNLNQIIVLLIISLNYITLQLNFRLTSHSFVDSESVLNWFLSFYVLLYITWVLYSYTLSLYLGQAKKYSRSYFTLLYLITTFSLIFNEFISYIFWVILKLKWGLNVSFLPFLIPLGLILLLFYTSKHVLFYFRNSAVFYLHLFILLLFIINLTLYSSIFINIIQANFNLTYYNYKEVVNITLNDYMLIESNFNLRRLYLNNNFLVYTPFRGLRNEGLSFLECYNFNNYNSSKYFLFLNNYLYLLIIWFILIIANLTLLRFCKKLVV